MTITTGEVAVLNAARDILEEHAKLDADPTTNDVRVATCAEIAEVAVFRFLNWTNAYTDAELSYEQLHRSPRPVEAVPEDVPS